MRVVLLLLVAAIGSAIAEDMMMEKSESRWWYAPSRKAPLYEQKYQRNLQEQFLRGVATKQGEDIRLPRDILPISYNIRLLPFIEVGNFTTHGYIEILVECQVATRNISLNAAELAIDWSSVKVVDTANVNVPLQQTNYWDEQHEVREIITIQMKDNLMAGKQYRISMNFVSFLNSDLRGFYRSSYEENGVTKYIAVSQMEAPDARRAFPCFDEPNMKATFTITIGHKNSMSAISNMPLNRTEPILGMEGYQWDHFKPSVKMSSYLVAMMVSEFINVTSTPELSPGVEFKIWARSSFRDQTAYSADIGPKILNDFDKKYFNIPFPLPKMDMAAIPDFAAGAMENWGLITYREADLLFDPARSSASAKQRVAAIIAHELAHQWFGNLVTMDWWNVIWLNEGFASYMEYIGTDFVEPGFEMDQQFAVSDLHYVFGIDALESSRPIDFQANTPDEINQMFDAISYEKGSCIIRMCANFMGEPTFRRGVTRYLNKHSFGNTVQEDLWRALQEQADEEGIILPASIKTIMDTWTRQMGYPVINVTRTYDWTKGAYVSQERYLLRKSENSTDKNNYRWWIPLTYTSNFSEPNVGSHWYPSGQNGDELMILEGSSSSSWVVFNVGQEGYYRVIYDQRNIELIQQQLMSNHKAISNKNRAQIMDDYLNLARANLTSYVTAMELTRYLKHEHDYAPWTAASVALDYIDIMFYSLQDENRWKTYMNSLVADLYGYVDYDQTPSDSHLKIFTRSQAISWACGKLNVTDCVENAKTDYQKWMADATKELSPNLRRQIACTAIANGGRSQWQFGYNKYLSSTLVNEKIDLLRATTCSVDERILNEMLEMMINATSGIRLQDANTVFSNIAANPVGHQVALNFLTNRWNDVYEYFGTYQGFGGGTMARLFRALCNRVNTQAKLDQLTKLFDDHPKELASSKTANQGLEVARSNVLWVNKHYNTIVSWLKIQTDPSTTAPSTTTPSTIKPAITTPKPSSARSNHFYSFITIAMTLFGRWILHSCFNVLP